MLRWTALAGIFALPFIVFIVANSLFFPYITGKNFAFRIIVEIITASWLALALINPAYRPKKTWLLAAFAAFVAIIAVADATGVNPFKSFWSNYERMDGWVTLAHLFAYFVVAGSILGAKKLWRRFWLLSLGVSVISVFMGVKQFIGISASASGLTARLDSTFGNPIYLAVFMLFNIFIAAFLWAESWRERQPGKRLGISLAYGGIIALDTIILLLTGTRGTILGLVGGAILAFLIYAFLNQGQSSTRLRVIAVGSIAAIVIAGGSLWLARDTAFVNRVGFLGRLASISLQDNTTKSRFMNWGMAWEGVKERPLLGWGQENYAIVFDNYYNPGMYAQEQWFDRVHNIIFDWLVAGGFLGLISYLLLFISALWIIWRGGGASVPIQAGRQKEKNAANSTVVFSFAEQCILTGLLAGYFFHNLFVFDNISSYILFTTILAYIASRYAAVRNAPTLLPMGSLPRAATPIVAVAAIVLAVGSAWGVNNRALAQNRALLQAIAPHQEGITVNLKYFQEAVAYQSLGTQEAREQLAQVASQIAGNQQMPDDVKQKFGSLAANEMILQEKASPLDARFPLFLGIVYKAYGDYENAGKAFARAHELSRGKQSILFEMGANAQSLGKNDEAIQDFKEAFELLPEYNSARVYYAAALIRAKQESLAEEILAPAVESGAAADPNIASAYVSIGRYDKIVEIWRARVKAMPNDMQARFTLAAALYQVGNPLQAIAVLEEVKTIDPSTKAQAEEFIKQIKSGSGI
ncbi:MAG: O-antigen ligase family protein [bacterium]|nr:O-antigen ligase family protein [bacterium]